MVNRLQTEVAQALVAYLIPFMDLRCAKPFSVAASPNWPPKFQHTATASAPSRRTTLSASELRISAIPFCFPLQPLSI